MDQPKRPAESPSRLSRLMAYRISRRKLKIIGITSLSLLLIGTGLVALVVHALSRDLPSPARLQTIQPSLKTLVFSADGDTIHEFFRENRVPIALEDVPPGLIQAIIATEDRNFYEHYGLYLRGMARAVVVNLQEGRRAQGGSTLTQQLARSLFLHQRKEWTRKLREMLLALQIERSYSKDEILEMYVNTIYFGGAYGVQAASKTYYNKPVQSLNPAEYTMLAGILNNPGYYSPWRHPERAYERRAVVLSSMVRDGALAAAEAESIGQQEVLFHRGGPREHLAPYFVEEIRQYLEANYGTNTLYEDGLHVYTTLDAKLQRSAEKAFEEHLLAIEKDGDYEQTRAEYDTLNVDDEDPPRTAYLQGALVALDARNGHIRAMIGGRDYVASKFNRSTQGQRQPGSIFKPFLYTAALERGFTPADILLDAPVEVDTGADELWRPVNFSGTFRGSVSLRQALAYSINIPAVRLIQDIGTQPVIQTARRMGITSKVQPVLSIALGSSEVNLLEMVSAYTAFANRGLQAKPMFLTQIRDYRGELLEEIQPFTQETLDERTAYLMADMMRTGLQIGTGRSARSLGFKGVGAGKTGTTDLNTDAWFIGFTPELVCGVWTGFDMKQSMGRGRTGAVVALPIWARTLANYYPNGVEGEFRRPAGLSEAMICIDSGQKPSPACPELLGELFPDQSRPNLICELHQPGIGESRGRGRDFEAIDSQASRRDEFGGGGRR